MNKNYPKEPLEVLELVSKQLKYVAEEEEE